MAKNLRNAHGDLKSISIAPDYTKDEREKQKILIDSLKQKRLQGEYHWYISKGKLYEGQNQNL